MIASNMKIMFAIHIKQEIINFDLMHASFNQSLTHTLMTEFFEREREREREGERGHLLRMSTICKRTSVIL